ncbi:ComEC/Rec2 family competence protein [Porphyromonas sp.]
MAKLATMKVWNVEHGLAIHIEAPNGKCIVVDLGCSPNFSPLMRLRGKEVHYMVITHPDLDHIQDVGNISYARPKVLDRAKCYTRQDLLEGAKDSAKDTIKAYCDFVESYNKPIPYLDPDSPHNPNVFGGLQVQTFRALNCDKSKRNNQSAIVVLTLGNAKVVICGDNQEESFNELMQRSDFKEAVRGAWILVASHHGRRSGYHQEFMKLVNPYLTIISDTKKGETSVTDSYKRYSKGYRVHSSNGCSEVRYCLTTRQDGSIQVVFGTSDDPKYVGTLAVEKGIS